jgi:hypothetical protein
MGMGEYLFNPETRFWRAFRGRSAVLSAVGHARFVHLNGK